MGREIFNGNHVQIFGRDQSTGNANSVSLSDGAVHVVSPAEVPGALTPALIRDLTNVRQSLQYPSGAKWATLTYRLLPGATATANQFARIVINALSDADANGRLATDGAYIAMTQGDEIVMTAITGGLIYRIDVIASSAVGTEKTLLQVLAGI